MKLVLSRKGFDSGSGGCLSPYNHETGQYIWFPIPEKVNSYSNQIRYPNILVKNEYLSGLNGSTLSEVYKSLKGTDRVKLRKNEFASIDDNELFAHFDPMLGIPPWIEENEKFKIGKGFGQFNAAPHLEKHNVNEGSVFLFFGGFQSTSHRKISGHYIYGWLKIKKRIETYKECKEIIEQYNLDHHPHISEAAFNRNQKNYIFLPDKWLFEDLKIPGCGYFTTLNDSLLLSSNKESNKATWKLPIFFYQNLTQVHQKTWQHTQDGFCTVKTGIGQEFVTQLSAKGEEWFRELFVKNQNNIHRHETPAAKGRSKELDFQEYLMQKHTLKKGERKLQPISVEQYIKRLESMRRHGIYNEENLIDDTLVGKIQEQYKEWKTYLKTVEHYLNYKTIIQ
ncbi:hypothetical protein DFO70_102457 [Cytobacillus firmus]|uniref:Nucleotide modification associated domain-containing protein n=2 Tax=Cytobacillus TaxID=2675230 RepID=A0A366K377_CYTFI|nr:MULTISPECIES: hypothetical protein [Cytobacillus]RBP96130.1 hypothetical protein DFO70_102457 [Cytobacillus firmus]TDX45043.1 hypothetical protein DFO72_103457 [Cytobacillus oceanisediminis]